MWLRWGLWLFWAGVLAIGCSNPKADIEEVLRRREEGLRTRNIELYMSAVSPDYKDEDGEDYAALRQKVQRSFQRFEQIDIRVAERHIYLRGDEAEVVEKFILSFSSPEGRKTLAGEEHLKLRKGKQGWRIVGGL